MNILIVEDDEAARVALETNLNKLGYDDILVAEDGESAWELFENNPVDMILSDWLMPNMDGIEFCKKIRESPKGDGVFFMFITVLTSESSVVNAQISGANDYINKPIKREILSFKLKLAEIFVLLNKENFEQRHRLK